jgi:hypothetical protein
MALAVVMMSGCASTRILRLENEVLRLQNDRLREMSGSRDTAERAQNVTLDQIATWLQGAGYVVQPDGDGRFLRLNFGGVHTDFVIRVQIFERERLLFIATKDYLQLESALDAPSVVALLVQLATLNYDLLLGKFQLNPESGEIMLSTEVPLDDGLSVTTLVRLIDEVSRSADARYPELVRAAGGRGL